MLQSRVTSHLPLSLLQIGTRVPYIGTVPAWEAQPSPIYRFSGTESVEDLIQTLEL